MASMDPLRGCRIRRPLAARGTCVGRIGWLLVVLLSWQGRADEPLALDYFIRPDELSELAISPDGDYVAAISGSEVIFYTLEPFRRAAGVPMRVGTVITDIQWLTPTRVAFNAARADYHWGVAVDRDGNRGSGLSDNVLVGGPDGRPVRAETPSDRILAFYNIINARAELIWLDTATGRKAFVDLIPLRVASVLADGNKTARLAIGRDMHGNSVVLWNKGNAWTPLPLPGIEVDTFEPRLLTPDARLLFFTAVRANESLNGLFRFDLEHHEMTMLYSDS